MTRSKQLVVITALRRSGTTALWQGFRGLPELDCFDEPFHPRLADGARENNKGTWPSLAAFLERSGAKPVAIAPTAELTARPTSAEIAWMEALSGAAPRVVMDVVRCWNRLPALCSDPDQVLFVMLVRAPAGWVTGHLRPSGNGTWRKTVMDVWRRASFFSRRGFYDNYHYETIIDAALAEEHPLWGSVTMSLQDLRRAPAYIKLLAFWWGVNLATYQSIKVAGVTRLTLTLDEFSANPDFVMGGILEAAGWKNLNPDLSHVKSTRPSHGVAHPAWSRAARQLGIPAGLFAPGGTTSEALEAAFDAALAEGRTAR